MKQSQVNYINILTSVSVFRSVLTEPDENIISPSHGIFLYMKFKLNSENNYIILQTFILNC